MCEGLVNVFCIAFYFNIFLTFSVRSRQPRSARAGITFNALGGCGVKNILKVFLSLSLVVPGKKAAKENTEQ